MDVLEKMIPGSLNAKPEFVRSLCNLKHIDRLSGFFFILWLFSMISIPIQGWVWGEGAVLRGTVIGVLFQAITVTVVLIRIWSMNRALITVLGIVVFAWAVEWLGSSTGVPFGLYHYTERLQPQLLGVPLLIPFAWLMMIPPAWAVAARIVRRAPRWWFVAVSAAAFTAWDLFLDPQMVHWGLWAWDQPGDYFGIPWVNFLGWFVAVAALTLILRPERTPDLRLMWVYALTWGLESMALIVFWGLPGPGVAGFFVMGMFVAWTWRRGRHTCS